MSAITNGDNVAALRESLQVKPPDEIVNQLNLLVYGEPGVGKTYLAGTADDDPRTSPVLYLGCGDGSITTIRNRASIDAKEVRSITQLEEIYNTLYHSIDPVTNRIYYSTVIIDPITEVTDLDMRTIMKAAYQQNPERVDIDVPSPREWGKNRNHTRLIVRAFRDLPCHTIVTAQLGTSQEEGQPMKYFPGFAGKLKTEIPGLMDVVGYLYADATTGETVRKMQVVGTRRVQAKDRTARLGNMVENPTIPMLWDMIQLNEPVAQPEPEPDSDTNIESLVD